MAFQPHFYITIKIHEKKKQAYKICVNLLPLAYIGVPEELVSNCHANDFDYEMHSSVILDLNKSFS